MEAITEYKSDNRYLIRVICQLALRLLLTWIFLVLLGQCIGVIWNVNGVPASSNTNFWLNFSLSLAMSIVGFFISYNTTVRNFNKLSVKLDAETITKIAGSASSQFRFSEIAYLKKNYHGNFFIYSTTGKQLIVPYYLTNYNELEEILKKNVPVFKAGPYTIFEKYYNVFFLIYLALYLIMLVVTNKIAVALIGAVLVCGLLLSYFRSYQTYKSAGIKVGKMFYVLMLIFVAVLVASTIRRLTLL
jgi:hypothetical protein